MELFDAINTRYSYRGTLSQQPVLKEDLDAILQAGVKAPTGHNYQTPAFIAITDPALCRELGDMFPYQAAKTAPAFIVVLSYKKSMPNGVDFELVDYAIAGQNIWLALTALGYASVWIDGQLYDEGRAAKVKELLHTPAEYTPRIVFPIGIPAEEGPRKEKLPFAKRVHYNGF